ncbi:hypothetical protein [Streptomyces clavuligerus]|uniref:hypothetical protein n=1 Tax=Streptomyces clavuligerus TaxID=1901 RepID=UPI001E316C00|nr:hypothetical protein [Streptomyces clavuligerus]
MSGRAAAPPAEVREPARSPHPGPRLLPARRRDLPAGIRDVLAAAPDAKVVTAVASHPGLSGELPRSLLHRHAPGSPRGWRPIRTPRPRCWRS